jgi:copper chaperone CopZ
MITETIKIEGMSCAGACVRSVKQALNEVEGLTINEVGLGYAKVSYETSPDLPKLTRQAIEEAGFKPVS